MRPKSTRPPPLNAHGVAIETNAIPTLIDEEGSCTDQTAFIVPKSVRSAQRATLMVLAGGAAGKIFRIEGDRATVGRATAASLSLQAEGMSRVHCAVVRDPDGRYFLEDLGSTNGTIVNGSPVTRVHLNSGDRIQLGPEVVLQFGFYDDAEEGLAVRLYEAATRDPLTRAHTRRYFEERLGAELAYAARHSERLVAVLFDIDHFKSINDSYGHAAGDSVLHELSALLGTLLRAEDVFARYGGEEFAVLARGLNLRNGVKLAERMREAIAAKPFVFASDRFKVTVSAGVAELAECKPPSGERLLQLADARLYKAKEAGRNRVLAK